MKRDTRLSDVLHVLLHRAQVKEPFGSEVLARAMGTSSAIFAAGLCEAGHVKSGKGHGGGWQLARSLKEFTLLAAYEPLDRPAHFALSSRNG